MCIRGWFAAALLVPAAACAHEHRLSPTEYEVPPGRTVAITAGVGEGLCGEPRPYLAGRTVRFVARTDRVLDLTRVAEAGDTVWARFKSSDAYGAMLAWESDFVLHRMQAAEFDAYLGSDGLDGPRAARRASRDTTAGRERYRRCSKLWLAGSDRSEAATRRATEALGLPLELVPLEVPGSSAELRVRLLFGGVPLSGALVQAWRDPLEVQGVPAPCGVSDARPVWQGRTDADGLVSVPRTPTGAWLIGAVHMISCADRDDADWESTWASLAFGIPRTAPPGTDGSSRPGAASSGGGVGARRANP